MSYTIYTISDPQTLGAAMNGMALFFGQESWIASALQTGLVLSLIFILAQGVLQKGLRLDVMLLQLIVVWGAFLPKTTVVIEQFNHEAAPIVVDNVPYAIAIPGAVAGAFALYMTEKIETAVSGVDGYPISVTGAEHPFTPAKILLGFASCPSDPLKCLDRNLAETMRNGIRYCGGSDLSNIRFHKVSNVLEEFANTMTRSGSTVIYTKDKPYQDGGGGGEATSCSGARSHLLGIASAIDSGEFGAFTSAAQGIVNQSTSRRYHGNTSDISLDDALTLVANVTDDIGRIDALALTNVMTYSIAAQMALNASSPIDQMNVIRADNGLFRWAEESSYTAFMTSTTAPKMMDILFFIFIAATPLIMFVVVANPQSGLKTAGSYVMFGIWTQSWTPVMAIVMAWYQVEIENYSQPGTAGVTVEYVSGLMRHVMVSTITAGKMIENAPFMTFAILTGSMFALSQMVSRLTSSEMPRYNPDVGGEMKGAGGSGGAGASAHRDMALGKLANLYGAQTALAGGLGSAPVSGDANAVFGSGGLSTISVDSGLSDGIGYSSQQTLAAKSGVNESVGKLLNVAESLKESATQTQTAGTGGSSQTEFTSGTAREAGVTRADGSQTQSGTTTRAGSNNSFAFSEGLTVSKNLLGGISQTAGEESRDTSLPMDRRTSAAGVEQAARAAQQAIQEAAAAGGSNAALNQAAQQAADAAQQAATNHDQRFAGGHGGKTGGILKRALAMLPDVRIQGGANAQQGTTQAVEGFFGKGNTTATTGSNSTKFSSTSGEKAGTGSDYKNTDQTSQSSERMRQAIDNAQQAVSRLYEAAATESAMRSMQSQLQSSGTQQLSGAQVTNQYGDMMRAAGQASGTSGEALNALMAKMAPVFSGQGEAFAQFQREAQNNLPQMEMHGRGSMLNNDQKAAAAAWQALSRMANSGDLSHRILGQAGALQMAQAAGIHTAVDPMALAAQAGALAGLRSGVEAQFGSFGAGVDYQMGSAGGSGHYGAPRGEPMGRTTAARREQFGAMIDAAAQRHGLDPALLHGLVRAESNYNPNAVSPAGAVGLGQLTPATAERFGVPAGQLTDPQRNIEGAAKYLSWLMNKFGGNEQLALAGYNAGEGAVMKYGNTIPPYKETQAYVPKVLGFAAQERERRGQGMGGFEQSRGRLQAEGAGFRSQVDAGRRETADRVDARQDEIIQRGKDLVADMQGLIKNAVQRGEIGSDGQRLNASELQALQRGLANMAMLPSEEANKIFLQGGNSSTLDAVFAGLRQMGVPENALNYLRDLLGSTPTQDGVPITNQAPGAAPVPAQTPTQDGPAPGAAPATVGGPTASTHMDSSAGSGAPLSSTQLDHARLQNDLGGGGSLRQTAMADAGASPGSMSDVATLRQYTEASALALQGGQANPDSATTFHQAPAYSSAGQSAMAADQGSGASGFQGGSTGASTGSLQSNEQGSSQSTSPTSILGTQGDSPALSQAPSTQGGPSSMNATNDGGRPTAPTGSHGEAGASLGAVAGAMTASIAVGGGGYDGLD
ncbi:conjugal transfer protein TraG N-terminal domain-containing protein [Allochromatium tepidum]|uniref:Transglycosylase SLT domain-containing protein n=1 Tax=Allochromatium tepidum TaxID=553982 RepID=A0ABN6GEV2_9GAMM|nr:conjugal transfer protein TraG N-terminal domain-containing protein [Allochromatium tepidum]BCU08445.1 hypothetical protein Atep_31220 [Allochromatium tepidum]